ncbi:MAG: FAD-binding protein [Chitinophagaceae bacterium]|nr:FAD-binding protein [Chitinophagaceae bacterium]
MESNNYDIAIIGGGLAGLSSAILAAREGFKVVVFEKGEYPEHKVCGEYISNESRSFLQRLGLRFDEPVLPVINQLNISDTSGKLYCFSLPLGGFGISRYLLDERLCQLAEQAGAVVMTNTKVDNVEFKTGKFTVGYNTQTITSTVVIGAFGKRSNLDLRWNREFAINKPGRLNNYVGVKYHIRYPHAENVIALHNFKDGYCGISKVENDISCLCYLTKSSNLVNSNNSIQQMEQIVLSLNPFLKGIFNNAQFIFSPPVAISQISFAQKSQVEDHVLLTGDSASMISPLCGNGMSMALHSAKIAFETVAPFLRNNTSRDEMEKTYVKNWGRQFKMRLATGRVVQSFFGNEKRTSFFLSAMNKAPFVAKKVIAATHGKPF